MGGKTKQDTKDADLKLAHDRCNEKTKKIQQIRAPGLQFKICLSVHSGNSINLS